MNVAFMEGQIYSTCLPGNEEEMTGINICHLNRIRLLIRSVAGDRFGIQRCRHLAATGGHPCQGRDSCTEVFWQRGLCATGDGIPVEFAWRFKDQSKGARF